PTVFVIPDQFSAGIGRKRGFSGAGESKENGGVIIFAHVGTTVHGQGVFVNRQDEIKGRENAFFDFARIAGTSDEGYFSGKVQNGEIVLARAIHFGVCHKGRHAQEGPFRLKVFQLRFGRTEKHVIG